MTPSPSPDELIIQQRGRRKIPITFSPDIDVIKQQVPIYFSIYNDYSNQFKNCTLGIFVIWVFFIHIFTLVLLYMISFKISHLILKIICSYLTQLLVLILIFYYL